MTEGREITIKLLRRGDDGLRVYSDDVPGLILSGPDPDRVMAMVLPALQALDAWERNRNGELGPAKGGKDG